jgi:hypothetical protein
MKSVLCQGRAIFYLSIHAHFAMPAPDYCIRLPDRDTVLYHVSQSSSYDAPGLILLPTMSADGVQQSRRFIDRLSDALIYVIAFPFIAIFIALKRAFTERKEPPHSYRDRLPNMHPIGPDAKKAR